MFSNSIKIQKENLKGGIFLLPGVGLLLCFGILPICLAFYMSLHRWKPVQGRFMGLSHYEKAIGDLTSAMLTLTALAMLIVGIWLLKRNWKQTTAKQSLTLCYAVGATMVVLLSWRVFEQKSSAVLITSRSCRTSTRKPTACTWRLWRSLKNNPFPARRHLTPCLPPAPEFQKKHLFFPLFGFSNRGFLSSQTYFKKILSCSNLVL